MTQSEYMTICGLKVRRGYYTDKRRFKFKTEAEQHYSGRFIPAGSWCEFWETTNWGFLKWVEPNGDQHLAKE